MGQILRITTNLDMDRILIQAEYISQKNPGGYSNSFIDHQNFLTITIT